jgi:hypothetical protein
MDFPDALKECIAGKRITNENWNGKGMYVYAVEGTKHGDVETLPYLMMRNAKGQFVHGWLISQMDVFSDGWKVLE